jgi:hypothetical protein
VLLRLWLCPESPRLGRAELHFYTFNCSLAAPRLGRTIDCRISAVSLSEGEAVRKLSVYPMQEMLRHRQTSSLVILVETHGAVARRKKKRRHRNV